MYSLFNYMNDSINGITAIDRIVDEELKEIDNKIICEALNSNILRTIAQQLDDFKEFDKKIKKRNWFGHRSRDLKSFAGIFCDTWGNTQINWSTVKDEDFIKYDISDTADPKKLKKAHVIIKKSLTINNGSTIIIFYDSSKEQYSYVICPRGKMYSLLSPRDNQEYTTTTFSGGEYVTGRGKNGSAIELKKSDKFDMVTKSDIMYVLEITGEMRQKVIDTRLARKESKEGMVLMDENSLREYARENIKRYKEIVAKNKIERINNTELIDKVNEIVVKASDIITKYSKDTIKYADKENDVNILMKLIYDVGVRSNAAQGTANGLLRTFAEYTKYLKRVKETTLPGYKESVWNNRNSRLEDLQKQEKELKRTIDIIEKHMASLGIE